MDLIKNLENSYGKKFKIKFTKKIPTGDIKKTYANTIKIKKIIKWKPKISLKKGLEEFVKWYKADHAIK